MIRLKLGDLLIRFIANDRQYDLLGEKGFT